ETSPGAGGLPPPSNPAKAIIVLSVFARRAGFFNQQQGSFVVLSLKSASGSMTHRGSAANICYRRRIKS
ncbi:MAG: hypothetical protein ACE5FH_05710, partial [Candidatus Zixiibacteriota bacterium]